MAIPLTPDAIGDFVKSTLQDFGRFKWTNIQSNIQKHIFVNEMLRKEKTGFETGSYLQWNIAYGTAGNARMTGIGVPDIVNIKDGMVQAQAPWRFMVGAWGYSIEEMLMNRNDWTRVYDLIKFRREQCYMDIAELLEQQGWQLPASTDTTSLFGIPYWIVPSVTQGFNGGNPYGYTAGAGSLSSTTYPNWQNYTDQFNDFSRTDLVSKMQRAAEFCNFETPDMVDDPSYATGSRRLGIYTVWQGKERMERIAAQQNDNLGNDVVKMMGKVTFHGTPIRWVPYLEKINPSSSLTNAAYAAGTSVVPYNPFYMIDWSEFKLTFLKGNYMRETGPERAPGQHNMHRTFSDSQLNTQCHNRRSQALLMN